MKFGINLYGVLKDRKDVLPALKELRALGYSSIEPCVAPGVIEGQAHVFWPMTWLKENLSEIHEMGLALTSVHLVGWNVATQREQLKDLAKTCGIRHFVVKSPAALTEEAIQQTAMEYMILADTLQEAGAEVLVHNEGADIEKRFAGQTACEYLLSQCLGKVYAQVDAGWALVAGEDPERLLWRLGSLVHSLHYKDFRMASGKTSPTPVGGGELDVTACFQFARAMGIPQLIDLDDFGPDPSADLRASLQALAYRTQDRLPSVSYLNTLDVETGDIKVLHRFKRVIEAPNWLKGKAAMVYNSEGHIYTYDINTGVETMIDTGDCDNCNNDHVISPDERSIAVSHSAKEEPWASRVYVLPIEGGKPRLVTPNAPSYLHGWSPDGKEFAYCAFREHDGKQEVDIYTIPVEGGEETRLTGGGFNDGPEYAPDGEHIWFNSTRSGLMQIWRMKRDGSEQTQMTYNERNKWFGHVSPDGEKVVYLSYGKDDLEADEHLPNMRVELWMMNADGSGKHRLLSFFGGQGSINVNSWAADSRHIAFVSYEILHK